MSAAEPNQVPEAEFSADAVELIHTCETTLLICQHLEDWCLLDDRQCARNYRIQLEACCKKLATLLP
jgi:hypothetical protein